MELNEMEKRVLYQTEGMVQVHSRLSAITLEWNTSPPTHAEGVM